MKKNKVIYSNIQPNPKEVGIWVNTDNGNVKVEKNGKWVDDSDVETPSTPSEPVKVNVICFTISGTPYLAEEGMTWGEWVISEYNDSTYAADSPYIAVAPGSSYAVRKNGGAERLSYKIESKGYYTHGSNPNDDGADFE